MPKKEIYYSREQVIERRVRATRSLISDAMWRRYYEEPETGAPKKVIYNFLAREIIQTKILSGQSEFNEISYGYYTDPTDINSEQAKSTLKVTVEEGDVVTFSDPKLGFTETWSPQTRHQEIENM